MPHEKNKNQKWNKFDVNDLMGYISLSQKIRKVVGKIMMLFRWVISFVGWSGREQIFLYLMKAGSFFLPPSHNVLVAHCPLSLALLVYRLLFRGQCWGHFQGHCLRGRFFAAKPFVSKFIQWVVIYNFVFMSAFLANVQREKNFDPCLGIHSK